jgi:hypothetical protein
MGEVSVNGGLKKGCHAELRRSMSAKAITRYPSTSSGWQATRFTSYPSSTHFQISIR